MNHFNSLTPAQAERLAILAQAAAALGVAIARCQQHGLASFNLQTGEINLHALSKEVGAVVAATGLMVLAQDIRRDSCDSFANLAAEQMYRLSHHQQPEFFASVDAS